MLGRIMIILLCFSPFMISLYRAEDVKTLAINFALAIILLFFCAVLYEIWTGNRL